ncbi:MAG: Ig-like domain repeat protein, partial [Deltaproteobacteria bacterium]|nr:Ig-like domain repeat protein [Deltaproteobacteria bacterium]
TTYAWSKVSGPGTITFGTSAALSTTISANAEGTYILRFTATDGAGNSAYSDMTLVWSTTLPAVNANPAGGTLYKNSQFTQTATASSSQSLTMSYVWSLQAGPEGGAITFGTPNALTTIIAANQDGSYTLRLAATDAAGNTAYSQLVLVWDTVKPTVSAGADKTTNAQFTQTATVTDSLATTYAWSMVSGPGVVTFGSSLALSTTVSANSDGTYILRFTATDSAGNSAYSDMTLLWDTVKPTVSAGANKTTNAQFTQTATVTDTNTMIYAWTATTGGGAITFGSPSALATTISASQQGDYILRLTATDAAGNSSFGEMTLIWDTTVPSVSAGGSKTANAQFTQTATASDATALTYQWTRQSGPGVITFGSPTALVTTISASADGSYVLRLVASDAAGNSAFSDMNLTWDTVRPFVSAGTSSSRNATYTQIASASDPLGMTFLWSYTPDGPGTIVFGSPGSLSTTVTADNEGTYRLIITATDTAGNVASSGEAILTWDLTPPTLEITTLPNNSYTNEATLPISGTVTDALSGVQRFTINGAGITLDGSGTFNHSIVLAVGANVISMVSSDFAGNTSYDVRTITLDPSAPSLIINSPGSDYKTNLPNITITGTVDKECSISIHVSGGGLEQSFSNVPVSGNIFTLLINGLAVGRNSIDITATSNANLRSTKSVIVTYDNFKPLLDVTSPAGDIRSSQDSILFSGTVSDSHTGVGVTIIKDLETYRPQVVNGSFSQTIPLTEKKVYIIAVKASDEAGNESIVKRRVIYDTPNGDINGDGRVDIADALLALQVSVGMTQQLDSYLVKGDVGPLMNGLPAPDWKIDISDIVLILRTIVGSLSL